MTTRSKALAGALAALALTGLGAAARAQETDAAEAQAFASAPVQLVQAIAAAEAAQGGKVMSIEFDEGGNGQPAGYAAEVLLPDGTKASLFVDAASGAVGPGQEDDGDDDDDGGDGDGAEGEDG